MKSTRFLSGLAAGVVLCMSAAAGVAADAAGWISRDFETLTATPNRLAGREDGSRAASKYVETRLKEIGLKEIYVQEFPVVMPRNPECVLIADGVTNEIKACRANLIQGSITPAEGLSGETLYAGTGELKEYGTNSPAGKIVVLEADSARNWLNAFALGASAVIFVEDAALPGSLTMHLNVPANLPRFYVTAAQADKLGLKTRATTVTLKSSCVWEDLRGRNVIGVIRGTGAVINEGSPAEAILLSAPLDSFSEVPELSAGARDAANCAVMLHLAEALQKNPPKRDIIIAFMDGQWQNHLGARAFYGALYRVLGNRKLADFSVDERLKMLDAETGYLSKVMTVLSEPDIFAPKAMTLEGFQDTLRHLRGVVAGAGAKVMQDLAPLRVSAKTLRSAYLEEKDQARKAALLKELTELSIVNGQLGPLEKTAVDDLAWNSILRVVNEKTSVYDSKVVASLTARMITDTNEVLRPLKKEMFEKQLKVNMEAAVATAKQNCTKRLHELELKKSEVTQAQKLVSAVGQQKNNIIFNIAVNLGDRGKAWSVIHGDNSMAVGGEVDDSEGAYSGVFKNIREMAEGISSEIPNFDIRPICGVSSGYQSKLFSPSRNVDAGGVVRMFGKFNVSMMTLNDPLERQGSPTDRAALLNLTVFEAQGSDMAVFVKGLGDMKNIGKILTQRCTVWYNEPKWDTMKNSGCLIRQMDVGDRLRTAAVPGALFAALPAAAGRVWESATIDAAPPGMLLGVLGRSQADGVYELPAVTRTVAWPVFAVLLDSRGLITATTVGGFPRDPNVAPVGIANVRGISLVGCGYNRVIPSIPMKASSTTRFRDDRSMLCENGNVLVLFAPYDSKAAKIFNSTGMVFLENKPEAKLYQGVGFELFDAYKHVPTSDHTAKDLFSLNAYRVNLLRDNKIGEESLEVLHSRAGDIAADCSNVKQIDQKQGMLEASAAFSRRMYDPLVSVMNDLVTAVVFLLLLTIPFAFALERLLVGTPHIYHRIAWFALFFALTFAVLYMVNPAFKLAATPIIIFLAFAIILLSVLVMFIMIRKLETEMKKLQGRSASAHSVDVSRISTMAAAVGMGISTMRRRPLRTLLTSVTVILLTFTILTFASFSSVWGNRKSFVGPMNDPVSRVLVRHQLWDVISQDTLGTIRGYLAERAEVVPLYWLAPLSADVKNSMINREDLSILISTADGKNSTPVSAAIGLHVRDLERQPVLRDCFAPDALRDMVRSNGIFVSHAVSTALNLTPGDIGVKQLIFKGRPFVYAGTMSEKFAFQPMIDGSSMLPVDYRASIAGGDVESLKRMESDSETSSFMSFDADKVVVISAAASMRMGAAVRAVTAYPKSQDDVASIADDVATVTQLPTYVGAKGGVYRIFFSKLISASGFKDLLIPVILGGLIVFATMLGSVADREGEIYAFSSLGLAPAHVSMLFFAEASIYAVVGGMGGYLLGQVAASVLSVMSGYWHFAVPSMNFSSMNAIVTIFIVMGIVMFSTAYPAAKAARSANPGIQRAWRLPKADGDSFDINFPFTVSEYDLTGVVSYLEEHFGSFADTSVGVFTTSSCHVLRQKETDMLGFRANVALAPFDLGIEQTVVILSQPSDIEGIDEIRVLIKRMSGTYSDWQRANRVFINDLRRQFLVWRTLDKEVAKHYRETTLQRWDALAVESRADILKELLVKESETKA